MDTDPAITDLVEAARGYFLKFGYSRVSTGEIAASVGRSKKTLYKHFKTKESLLEAVMQRLTQEAETRILAVVGHEVDPVAALEQVLEQVAIHLVSTRDVLLADLEQKAPDLFNQVRRDRDAALAAVLTPLLERGASTGSLRADLQPAAAATVFIRAVEQLATPMELASQDPAARRLLDTLIRLVVDGLKMMPSSASG